MNIKDATEGTEIEGNFVPDMRVSAVRIFSHDVEAAAAFYENIIGLTVKSAAEHWVVFDVAGIDLIVESVEKNDGHGQALIGRFLGVSLTSPDILSTIDVLSEQGVEFLAPPAKQDWGGYLAHFYDLDRNIISLVS